MESFYMLCFYMCYSKCPEVVTIPRENCLGKVSAYPLTN